MKSCGADAGKGADGATAGNGAKAENDVPYVAFIDTNLRS